MPIEYEPSAKNITAHYANGVKLVLDFLETPFGERPGWIQQLGHLSGSIRGRRRLGRGRRQWWNRSRTSLPKERSPANCPRKSDGLDVTAHSRNFFDCIKSRSATAANPQVMRHSHIACHAAALSWILNRKLKLDPEKEMFIDDDEANSLRSRPAHDPWRA